jgi:hypothetical protein
MVVLILLVCVSTGRAQDVTEPSLKAAFIYNFAKFTEWPQGVVPTTSPFVACVLGERPIQMALERIVKDRRFTGREISVVAVRLDGQLRACHLLYVSGVSPAQVASVVEAVRGAPVLTVSDVDDFALQGGIAQMFVDNGKMRFDLNLEVAKRAGLQLSSKLLLLAVHVHDKPQTARP